MSTVTFTGRFSFRVMTPKGVDCHPPALRRARRRRASGPRRARKMRSLDTATCQSGAATSSCACTRSPHEECGTWCLPRSDRHAAGKRDSAVDMTHARHTHARMPACVRKRHRHHLPPDRAPRCRACCSAPDRPRFACASAGAGMAACAAGARLPWPSSGAPGSPTAASLDQCKAACDEVALRASSPPRATHSSTQHAASAGSAPPAASRASLQAERLRELLARRAARRRRRWWRRRWWRRRRRWGRRWGRWGRWGGSGGATVADGIAAGGGGDVALAAAAAPSPSRIVVQGRRLLDSRTMER